MTIIDDKSEYCIPFIQRNLESHARKYASNDNPPPFFMGLNGVQGAGKTTFVSTLRSKLSAPPFNLETVSFSLDDLYLTHDAQKKLAAEHSSNPLLQHRGQPGTHDIALGREIISKLRANETVRIPFYDKSAFDGEGDRSDESQWTTVNEGDRKARVVIFEGWCMGFRSRPESEVRADWEKARSVKDSEEYSGRLGHCRLEDLLAINKELEHYDVFTDSLDALIHLDAEDLHFVYDWRQEQERHLRASAGRGMTVDQVNAFVSGYYPSYELYTENLRKGVFLNEGQKATEDVKGKQLRLVVGRDRRVRQHYLI